MNMRKLSCLHRRRHGFESRSRLALISHLLKFCITAMTFHVFTNIWFCFYWLLFPRSFGFTNSITFDCWTGRQMYYSDSAVYSPKKGLQIVGRFKSIFYFWQVALAVHLAVITTMHNNHVRKVMWERIASNWLYRRTESVMGLGDLFCNVRLVAVCFVCVFHQLSFSNLTSNFVLFFDLIFHETCTLYLITCYQITFLCYSVFCVIGFLAILKITTV